MDLVHDPLPKLLRQIAIPAATSMFLQTLLNITSTWLAGRISTLAQASLSLSFPLFFVLIAAGYGLSAGGSALVARSLGAGDNVQVSKLSGQLIIMALVLGVALSFLSPFILEPTFLSLGATKGPYLDMCIEYMGTIFIFSPIFIFNFILNSFLTALGNSRSMRNALAVAVVFNLPLSWWFAEGGMGLEPLGVTGLAMGTVLVQAGTMIYLGYQVSRTCIFRNTFWATLKPNFKLQWEIAGQVIPPALNQASVGIGIYVISWFVGHFGPEAVAAYGVGIRFEQTVLLPAMGLSIATLPLTAQNDGAGYFERACEVRSLAIRWGFYIATVAIPLLILGGYTFASFLTIDEVVRSEGAWMMKFASLTFLPYLLLYINTSFLQGLKRPMFAIWIGLYRQVVAPLLVIWVLTFTLDLRLTGIWLGIAIVTISAAVFTEYYTRRVMTKRRSQGHDIHQEVATQKWQN